jgi:hypothetical protein
MIPFLFVIILLSKGMKRNGSFCFLAQMQLRPMEQKNGLDISGRSMPKDTK